MQNLPLHTLPFDLFMADLERRGFTITPDHHIRLQMIVKHFRIPDLSCLENLKLTLCPLFATSEIQQALFYKAFDHFFAIFKTKPLPPQVEKPSKADIPDTPEIPKWPYLLAFIIVLCVALVIVKHYLPVKSHLPEKKFDQQAIEIVDPGNGSEVLIDVNPTLETPKAVTQTTDTNPQEKKRSENIIPKPVDWRIPRYALLIALALGIFLSELYRFNHRKMVLQKQKRKKPPLSWPIKVPFQKTAYLTSAKFYTIARRFRNRLFSDMLRLDIPLTIDKSLASGGFPLLHYSEMTCLPEYLFLIDLPHFRNHYSGYASQIADALSNENIFVKRFHYMDNPQICFETIDSKRLFLDDLFRKYSDHRLIVLGTGDDFLHPLTGKPEPWIESFHQWSTRALLTPRPISEWGSNELTLNAHFPLFPATMDGLDHLSLLFDLNEKPSSSPLLSDTKPLFLPDEINADALESITDDPLLFQWICACAVYPELHWNLTVYVGTKILQKPVTEAQVLRLLQIPWFQKAEIPDPWRRVLIQKLTEANKDATHEAIVDLLEQNQPPEQSVAMDLYRLNLSIQKWMLKPKDPERRKQVQKIVFDESRLAKDSVILRMMDAAPKSNLDIVLPVKLRKLFFRHALPLFGLKSGIRLLTAICLALLLVLIAILPDLPRLLHWDDASDKPAFVLQKKTIEKGNDVILLSANVTAQRKAPLQIKWDDYPLPTVDPDVSDDFQWSFVPFDMALPPEALTPGNHQIVAGFTEAAMSDPLTIQILKTRAPPEPTPVTPPITRNKISEKGRLYITAIPDTARIEIKHVKKAYASGMALNAGTYTISVSQNNYVPQTRQISIKAGQDTRETITLKPFGSLTVNKEPVDSRVRIMNIKPVYQDAMALAPGRYSVVVSKEGFKTYEEWVILSPGENKVMTVDLNVLAKQYKITITSVPADAGIKFTQSQKEFANGMLLDKGIYEIELSRKGYISKVQSFEIKDKDLALSIELMPIPTIQTRFTNFLKMEFVFIKAGTFTMGSPPGEPERYDGETQHPVKLTKSFYMQTTEVTQGQWTAMMGNNPSRFKECGDNCPVERVSWEDVQEFIQKMNNQDKSWQYRLPTEAEWEYAARAGTTGPFAFGDCLSTDDANYDGNYPLENCPKGEYRETTIPVASLKANAWGLYDMHGNVWEWCFDWYGEYPTHSVKDPQGVTSGASRVGRGGSWDLYARYCRAAYRFHYSPGSSRDYLGCRLAAFQVQQGDSKK
ncbi:MAG: SUMF1/EgtB/PvdO family nonheme iron enzyme [Candidatus Magnetomorum sp.]|nr:SUMF1/EgtB/PvdO family nonheme iron enzyme [Candidatus Magnetomorum sp.]